MRTVSHSRTDCMLLAALSILSLSPGVANAQGCTETVLAKVVALDQAFYVNRFGALQAGGMIFALERDVISMDGSIVLQPGKVMVRPDKRPRPLTLRVNKGQCLEIQFHNLLAPKPVSQKMQAFPNNTANGSIPTLPPAGYQPNQQILVPSDDVSSDQNGDAQQPPTRYAGVHVAGLEWVTSGSDDGTFVGANDVAANDMAGTEKLGGLVPPGARITYTLYAAEEGAFLLTSGGTTVGDRLAFGGQLSEGLFGSVIVEPQTAEYYRSQVTRADLDAATVQSKALPEGWTLGPRGPACAYYNGNLKVFELTRAPNDPRNPNRGTSCVTAVDQDGKPVDNPLATDGYLNTLGGQPVLNYDAVFSPRAGRPGVPVLSMLAGKRGDARRELVASDLTAIITGPFAAAFGPAPPQTPNETYPEAQQPYREFAIHYHDDFMATQAFAAFRFGDMQYTLQGGRDFFAINYGMGGIGATLWANRLQIGPASECATCKFEEFFLSSWPNGDPAMVVDQPVNVAEQTNPPQTPATKAFYPDDPSNVYHSYLRDHVKFRILHAGTNITHVHHQHAHQWLHSPKSGVSAYRDSQMISPGATYTLDMVYGGSGNKNLTMGDSIFHCHFYPHFAQGMWALWRVHDVFERGTALDPGGVALPGARALPDGEIVRGTPIPGLVPLPTLAMAPMPASVTIVTGPVERDDDRPQPSQGRPERSRGRAAARISVLRPRHCGSARAVPADELRASTRRQRQPSRDRRREATSRRRLAAKCRGRRGRLDLRAPQSLGLQQGQRSVGRHTARRGWDLGRAGGNEGLLDAQSPELHPRRGAGELRVQRAEAGSWCSLRQSGGALQRGSGQSLRANSTELQRHGFRRPQADV